tara:strand:- start:306 stop:521 length:216 start_codon:yes stop_codon:yes gene_type:complete
MKYLNKEVATKLQALCIKAKDRVEESPIAKDVLLGAALGAVVLPVLPFVGVIGALQAGAVFGLYTNLTKSK